MLSLGFPYNYRAEKLVCYLMNETKFQKLVTAFPEDFCAVSMLLENLVHNSSGKLLCMSSVKMVLSHQTIN